MRRKITYDPKRDYYAILGIEHDASDEDIRQAYRRCVRAVHPDLHPDQADWATEQIQLINEAYGVLRDKSRRSEYDRLRWPHIPGRSRPARATYHSPYRAPDYDPNRPWWEQVSSRSPRHYPFAEDIASSTNSGTTDRPAWLEVSQWLRSHHLARLESTWLTLVGIWRTPYAGVLSVLSVMLAINVAVIIYTAITPEKDTDAVGGMIEWMFGTTIPQPTQLPPTMTPTPDRLHTECENPAVMIAEPKKYEKVEDTFAVIGTVNDPALWNYSVQIGFMESRNSVPSAWLPVRMPSRNQSVPEPPIEHGELAVVNFGNLSSGYYTIRLSVVLSNGLLAPCDVVVRH